MAGLPRGMLSRGALYALPVVTVLVVAFAVFVVGAPRVTPLARVYGGPTEGADVLAFRLYAAERLGESERSLAGQKVDVSIRLSDGWAQSKSLRTDRFGFGELTFEPPVRVREPVFLSVSRGRSVLAEGALEANLEQWLSAARRRGGWLAARPKGELEIRIAPGRGAFAVPFADPLLVEVRKDRRPVSGVRLTLKADGARLVESAEQQTDQRGRAVFVLAPSEHVVTVSIDAEGRGKLFSALPVVEGGAHAELKATSLTITSPIEQDHLFVSLVDDRTRRGGRLLELSADGKGRARGLFTLAPEERGARYAVVSSAPKMDTRSTIGWPLDVEPAEPLKTFEPHDLLLLDGTLAVLGRDEQRRRTAKILAGGFAVGALALALLLMLLRVRQSDQTLARHLNSAEKDAETRERIAPHRGLALLVALFSVTLGFFVIALIALFRIG